MIIPIKCFTCNSNVASKYKLYLELVEKIKNEEIEDDAINKEKTPEENAFNLFGITRYCCRRHFISHIDLVDKI